jgi:hypothetical protein
MSTPSQETTMVEIIVESVNDDAIKETRTGGCGVRRRQGKSEDRDGARRQVKWWSE